MADLQTQFNRFHETIKIDFDGNKPLRDKRDIIIDALRAGLKKKYPTDTPTFMHFNQGSYDMSTGVAPLGTDDYDIDVGIIFDRAKDSIKPVALKEIVYEILNAVYQRKVEIKRPCVRVQYQKAGEKVYHIDLAIYARGKDFLGNLNTTLYIAKGFPGSSEDKKQWEISDPHQLKKLIKTKIVNDSDREQFRRIIRYLKRWKDYNFSSSGTSRPTGIALTALCYNHFSVEKDNVRNPINGTYDYKYNDLRALVKVVRSILLQFTFFDEISVKLPVQPGNELFAKMSRVQMSAFKAKLENLKTILENATTDTQITTACMRLRGAFGDDFPTS